VCVDDNALVYVTRAAESDVIESSNGGAPRSTWDTVNPRGNAPDLVAARSVVGDEQWRSGKSDVDDPTTSPTGSTVNGGKESRDATSATQSIGRVV
jgi:hypothetical protein